MTTTKPMSVTRAKKVCALAVAKVTGALAATDWTAPGLWEGARKVEAADDRRWYRKNPTMARTAPEREAMLVCTMLDAPGKSLSSLYGVRAAHQTANIIGQHHAERLAALGIDRAELAAAIKTLEQSRRA